LTPSARKLSKELIRASTTGDIFLFSFLPPGLMISTADISAFAGPLPHRNSETLSWFYLSKTNSMNVE
jgi:hypothetical protein